MFSGSRRMIRVKWQLDHDLHGDMLHVTCQTRYSRLAIEQQGLQKGRIYDG